MCDPKNTQIPALSHKASASFCCKTALRSLCKQIDNTITAKMKNRNNMRGVA